MLSRWRTGLGVEALESKVMLSATAFEFNDVGYFVSQNAPRLERYDVINEAWLAPIDLAGAAGTPKAAHVDADGIYVAYGKSVDRYQSDGSGRVHLFDTANDVIAIHSDGNLLFLNHAAGLYTRFTSIDKTTNAVIDTIDDYLETVYGSSIAPEVNRIFGRSQGVSPADITYVEYDDSGQFLANSDSPYHGDYPGGSRTWVFPSGSQVVDSSGTIYATADLTQQSSFSTTIDDIDFLGSDVPIVLSGDTLTAYSPGILPTGSFTLDHTPSEIFVNEANVITARSDAALPTGIRIEIVPLSSLDPPTPGGPVDPVGLSFVPDEIAVAADGTVLLYSQSHQSIFRWDPDSQSYTQSIPLIGEADFMTYSAATNTAYLACNSGLIRSLDLDAANPMETPFAVLPRTPLGLSTAGPYLFAADPSGSGASHYTFAPGRDANRCGRRDVSVRAPGRNWCDPRFPVAFQPAMPLARTQLDQAPSATRTACKSNPAATWSAARRHSTVT